MRLGWQLLLPLAVLNALITAVVVALDLPWWVNGIAGLAIIVIMLVVIRSRGVAEGVRFEENPQKKGEFVLPSSVRLAKFEPSAAPAATEENGQQQQSQQDSKGRTGIVLRGVHNVF